MTIIDTTHNTPLPCPVASWGHDPVSREQDRAAMDFALQTTFPDAVAIEARQRLDRQQISQAFGIPQHMLDAQEPMKSATAEIRARGDCFDGMMKRMRAVMIGKVTKQPKGKHGKRPSRNALRAHRASQARVAKKDLHRALLAPERPGKRYRISFTHLDMRGRSVEKSTTLAARLIKANP